MKAYTDIEQSKKLKKILPLESADMGWYYSHNPNAARNQMWVGTKAENADLSCWSLAALLNVLPKIHKLKPILDLEENSIQYSGIDLYIVADNPVDACVATILKLHELKML